MYIVNAQKCVNSLRRRSDRNGLFTAITRSKGWVRVLGYGEDMDALAQEFEEIKKTDSYSFYQHITPINQDDFGLIFECDRFDKEKRPLI